MVNTTSSLHEILEEVGQLMADSSNIAMNVDSYEVKDDECHVHIPKIGKLGVIRGLKIATDCGFGMKVILQNGEQVTTIDMTKDPDEQDSEEFFFMLKFSPSAVFVLTPFRD